MSVPEDDRMAAAREAHEADERDELAEVRRREHGPADEWEARRRAWNSRDAGLLLDAIRAHRAAGKPSSWTAADRALYAYLPESGGEAA